MHALKNGHVHHMRASGIAHRFIARKPTHRHSHRLSQHFLCRSNASVAWLVGQGGHQPRTDYDAVIVLGGGLEEDGALPEWVNRRLDTAADVWRRQGKQCPILCLGGGTPHKPAILTSTHHVLHEATACAEYLQRRQGIESQRILKETSSYDTVGNGFFALAIHAIPAGWQRCAVVTSAFHMPRTRAIFETSFALGGLATHGHADRFELGFYAASDEGVFPDDVIEARLEREAQSLKEWKVTSARLHSLQDMHAWLHSEHRCYAVALQNEFGDPAADDVDDKALASY